MTLQVVEGLKHQGIVAAQKEGEGTIGNLFWYSIGSQLITREDLELLFNQAGLDHSWLPNPIRMSDAFRRATREIQKKKIPTSDPKVFINLLTREVFSDNNMIQRNVVVEKVDQSGKRLEYISNAVVITLDKKEGMITLEARSGNEQALAMAREVEDRFKMYSKYYASQNLRVMVSKILGSLAPTQVRPNGGVYFIPKTHQDNLQKLTALVNLLENSEAFSIPLFDTKDNRSMVNKKLHEDMLSVLKNCEYLIQADGVAATKVKEAIAEAKRVADVFKTYQSVVALDVEVLENHLNMLRERAITLMKKID